MRFVKFGDATAVLRWHGLRDQLSNASREAWGDAAGGADNAAFLVSLIQGRCQARNIGERFERLRKMGLRTVITGDNPLTAAAIAEKAGVDDFLAEATPGDKLACIARNSPAVSSLR